MVLLFVLQVAVLALLVVQAWRDTAWMIDVSAATRVVRGWSADQQARLLGTGSLIEARLPRGAELVLKLLSCLGEEAREPFDAVRGDVRRRLQVLRGVARLASVTTLMSIVVELSWGLGGGSGLQALQAGLPQRLAIADATTSLTIGAATLVIYVWLARRLRARGDGLLAGLRRMVAPGGETP